MKIFNQDQNKMTLKDGNASGLIIGVVLIIVGAYGAYYLRSTDGSSSAVWVAAAVLLFGLITIFASSAIIVNIDKSQNQIAFQRKRLLGSKSQNYNIPDALRVELRKSYHMQSANRSSNGAMSMPQEVLSYQSVIIFKDGAELPLDNVKNSSGTSIGSAVLMGGAGKELSIASQVATFLNIPFQEVGPGSAPTVMGMGGINL